MKYDFVNELGYMALATRLKRISEAMAHSGRQMYRELDMDIEPNWFLVFRLLTKFEELSVTEIAKKLHFSHPSVITMISKMENKGYLQSRGDKEDNRKKIFKLTKKSIDCLPHFEKVWTAGTLGVANLFTDGDAFLQQLESLEIQLSQADFMTRTLNELQK
ncbi:MAG: MarR family winged helix-turn-helix transcriptional regulator [Ekhidna sp.]